MFQVRDLDQLVSEVYSGGMLQSSIYKSIRRTSYTINTLVGRVFYYETRGSWFGSFECPNGKCPVRRREKGKRKNHLPGDGQLQFLPLLSLDRLPAFCISATLFQLGMRVFQSQSYACINRQREILDSPVIFHLPFAHHFTPATATLGPKVANNLQTHASQGVTVV